MEDQERPLALRHGLPRCLSGLTKLQPHLYLNRAKRRRLLDREFVRTRIGELEPDSGRPGDYDRRRMFAFYGNPNHRRELWKIWGDGPDAQGAPDSNPPPSLEFNVLAKHFGDAGEPPDRARLHEAATDLLQRLNDWQSLETAEQLGTTLEIFCLATVLDAPGLLQEAGSLVPELREEYAEVLSSEPDNEQSPAEAPDPPSDRTRRRRPTRLRQTKMTAEVDASQPLSAMDARWREVLLSLAALATEAAENAPSLQALDRLRHAVDSFEEIERGIEKIREADGATEELRSQAQALLEQIENNPACEEVDPDELDRLRGTWLGIPAIDPAKARAEAERLQGEVGQLVENLRRSDTRHRAVEDRLDTLRGNRPSDRQALRGWHDERDDLREEATRRRRERRDAEDALIEALAPSFESGEPRLAEDATVPASASVDDSLSDLGDNGSTDSKAPEKLKVAALPVTAEEPGAPSATSNEDAVSAQPQPSELPLPQPSGQTAPNGEPTGEPAPEPTPAADASDTASDPGLPAEKTGGRESSTRQPYLPEAPADRPEWDERAQRLRAVVADALTDDPPRLAFAHEVCRLAERDGIKAGQPPAQLLEGVLYASQLQQPNGPLVEPILSALERLQSTAQEGLDSTGKNVNALIGLAAALPTAVIAPYSGAATYLERLEHEGIEEFGAFTFGVAQRVWELQKAHVDTATVLRTARHSAHHQDSIEAFRRDLDSWSEVGQQRKLAYIPANRIWNVLRQDNNPLGRLTQAMRSRGQTALVRRLVAQLAGSDELRRIVDGLAASLLSSRQTIDGKTFVQFQRHLEEPLSLAQRYLDLEAARPPAIDHHEKVITRFVQALLHESADLLQRLDAMAEESSGDTLLVAASSLAGRAVRHAMDLLSPAVRDDERAEHEADFLLRSALLPFPDLGGGESPENPAAHQDYLDTLLESKPVELPVAFEQYCDCGDLLLAADIIDWLEAGLGEHDIDSLTSRLAEERLIGQRALDAEVEDIRQEVDLAFSKGRISADWNGALLADLESTQLESTENNRPRYNLLRGKLSAVRRDLEGAAREERERLRKEVAVLFPDGNDPQRQAIERSLEDDDLLVANEMLYRPRQDALHPRRQEGQSALQKYLECDHEDLRSCTEDWARLIRSSATGKRHGPLRFDRLDEGERVSAGALLEAWAALKAAADGGRDRLAPALSELMRSLGFIDPDVTLDSPVRGFASARLNVEPLERREVCPLPHFGSEARGRYRLMLLLDPPEAEAIHQRMEQSRRQEAAIIVSLHALGEHTRGKLLQSCLAKRKSLLTLDAPLLAFLAAQGGSRQAAFFACSLPYTYNQPFMRRASLVPPEMFFGRVAEADAIADLRGACFVYGGRQLGKTALLRHVERTYRGSGRHAVWIDLKAQGIGEIDTADIWPAIWNALREDQAIDEAVPKPTLGNESIRHFIEALHDTFNGDSGRRLLLLFDEADSFLERDAQNSSRESFAESSRLKSLMDRRDQSIKVVFAGLHNVLRTTTQSNHPLAHLGDPVRIGPFIDEGNQRHALDLLQHPLQACGFRFEPSRLAQRVLAAANYYPSLIQIYGYEIVAKSLDSDEPSVPRTITTDLLDSIGTDPDLQEEIRRRFEWTLQLDPRYEAITYAIALECHSDPNVLRSGIRDTRIQRHARVWYEAGFPKFGGNMEFSSLLREMVDLGVLRRIEQEPCHTLRNPNVLNLLGTSGDIENRLEDLSAEKKPFKPGPHDIRRHHADEGPLHRPLTLWQERQVIGEPYGHGVVVLYGVEAAGIQHVGPFLAEGPMAARELPETDSVAEFEEHLRRRLTRRQRDSVDPLVLMVSRKWKRDWVDTALRVLEGLKTRPYARIIFVADTQKLFPLNTASAGPTLDLPPLDGQQTTVDLAQTTRRSGMAQTVFRGVRLEPWTLGFAAKWLGDEPDIGHKLTSDQKSELALESGGWPVLLTLIRERIGRDGPKDLLDAGGMHEFMVEHAEHLRDAFGLDQPGLREAVRQVQSDSSQRISDSRPRLLREDAQNRLFGGETQIPLSEDPDTERTQSERLVEMLRLAERDGEGPLRVDPIVRTILDLSGN